ncbi:Leucine rich repeat flightless interacting [Paragonimus heterotremus]|uniref:Leucine rich repeat flightless interacting n=1 Tax=Paragonimus heterotremus TaxID=100268 RepID=A0A8J4SQX4_9TREM|nr:Leucine rich repeat flightless interacting [Paragonimus heterotremus]
MSNRHVNRTDISDMGRAAEETEVQRAANRQLIQEGRVIRSKEMERRRREEENGYDSSSKPASNNTSRLSSQRPSLELSTTGISQCRSTDPRDLRMQMIQLEEKLKGAMMANVQLDNDKQVLRYEVDLLKDKLEDIRDAHTSLNKAYAEKKRDLAYHRMQITELNHRLEFARKQIEARDELIVKHDLILLGATSGEDAAAPLSDEQLSTLAANADVLDGEESNTRLLNGVTSAPHSKPATNGRSEQEQALPSMALISKVTAELLSSLPETSLDSQILYLFRIKKELLARVEKLEIELEEQRRQPEVTSRYESRASRMNGPIQADLKQDLQNLRNQAQEYKYKLQEALQRNSALESDIVRLQGQIKTYKSIADSCEQQEADLKQDRRRFQRELREVQNQLEDCKSENARLIRKLDKLTRSSVAPSLSLVGGSLRGARESSAHR